jgi:D-sedoheptulose 7-phosphate isomerase
MPSDSEIFRRAVADGQRAIAGLFGLEPFVTQAAHLITSCLTTDHKLLVCGNGGSAADASDFCTEFACRFVDDRRPYPALNLSQGGSLVTATANDYGFEEVFARQVRAFGQMGDVLVAISTSGNSANIKRALEMGKEMNLRTIALLGRDGGKSKGIAEIDLIVDAPSTARIQEAHKFLLHVLCEICETRLPK